MSESLNAPFARSERPRLSCNSTVTNSQQSDGPVSPLCNRPETALRQAPDPQLSATNLQSVRNCPTTALCRPETAPQPSLTAKTCRNRQVFAVTGNLRPAGAVRTTKLPLHRFALHEAAFEPPAHRFVVQTQAQPRQQDAAAVNQRAVPQRFGPCGTGIDTHAV